MSIAKLEAGKAVYENSTISSFSDLKEEVTKLQDQKSEFEDSSLEVLKTMKAWMDSTTSRQLFTDVAQGFTFPRFFFSNWKRWCFLGHSASLLERVEIGNITLEDGATGKGIVEINGLNGQTLEIFVELQKQSDNYRDEQNESPLHFMLNWKPFTFKSQEGNQRNIFWALLQTANSSELLNSLPDNFPTEKRRELAQLFSQYNRKHYEDLISLMKMGKGINDLSKELQTPLIAALNPNSWVLSHKYSYEIIKRMLELGADVNFKDRYGKAPIHDLALEAYNVGMDEKTSDQLTEKNAKFIELLLKYGADINAQDNAGMTAAHLAVFNLDVCKLKALILNGVNLRIATFAVGNRLGVTPLEYAYKFRDHIGLAQPNDPLDIRACEEIIRILSNRDGA